MDREHISDAFNLTQKAKLFFGKLIPLSAMVLFAAAASANCPSPDSILVKYVNSDGAFGNDAPGADWKLVFDYRDAPKPSKYKNLQLIKIYLTKNGDDPLLRDVTCVYNSKGGPINDPRVDLKDPQNLYLTSYKKQIFGRGSTQGMLTLSDVAASYVTVSKAVPAELDTKWSRTNKMYFCSGINDGITNQCGGFVFADGEKDEQPNGYWFDVWSQCISQLSVWWPRCTDVKQQNYSQKMSNIANKYCAEPTCEQAITAMNTVANDLATYWAMCWKDKEWQGKLWTKNTECDPQSDLPAWPDYRGIK